MMAYLDENKNVVVTQDIDDWAKQFDKKNRVVRQDTLNDGCRISTVFLGVDYGFGGKSMWFETMIFPAENFDEKYTRRYATWGEAYNGHIETMYKYNEGTLDLKEE